MRFRSSDLSQHDHVGSVELCLSELIRPDHAITTTSHTLRVPGTVFKIRFFHVKHFKCVKIFKNGLTCPGLPYIHVCIDQRGSRLWDGRIDLIRLNQAHMTL